jgi:hypothetical protein
MRSPHPATTVATSVVAAAVVACGVTYAVIRLAGRGRHAGNRTSAERPGSSMPIVVGLGLAEAEEAVRSATGISRFDVRHISAAGPPGRVVAQIPGAGTRVPRYSEVQLRVSNGEPADATR